MTTIDPVVTAREIRIRGVVQGVGFRPFVYRLAQRYGLCGWVLNGADGVRIRAEGNAAALDAFAHALVGEAPPAARIETVVSRPAPSEGCAGFTIRESGAAAAKTTPISPDLPVCEACLRELFDPADRRYRYPYITCTDCGPRYSIVTGLPYDRPLTTMAEWPLCEACAREYGDPSDRRFHAQPLACPTCGPTYVLRGDGAERRAWSAIEGGAALLSGGAIVAVKGIGGYHLACDAENAAAVEALRARKYRKERPFALMARDAAAARTAIALDAEGEALLASPARPVVVAHARRVLAGVAPENRELGVMLPYAPLHHLLFAAGAPALVVMTSANRSGEPMAFDDAEAAATLAGIADAFLVGERRIARRVDDAVIRVVAGGPTILRRARGMAPRAVATLPTTRPILAVGADLKNAPALAVDGRVFAAQHVGDLDHLACRDSLAATVRDLCAIYGVAEDGLLVAHDLHPEYVSTAFAREMGGEPFPIQHHRAHVASVLAERGAWEDVVVGVAFDGTGFGDDGTIWGGEVFVGSVAGGLARVAHLATAPLPGGDAAARFPVQAAAGFLFALGDLPDLAADPFAFPPRYETARALVARDLRTFRTSSAGRLFDTVAALLGFTRACTFEGQAAMWLEHLAASAAAGPSYAFALRDGELDYRPLLHAVVDDRARGVDPGSIARAFHVALADAVVAAHRRYGPEFPLVVSGGVFQNRLLVELLAAHLGERLWINRVVPPNDGGIALGQAALAAFAV
ncbi:MAG TPA: carbamoyltransferase HypF [Candidatus Elarobacter sp.]